MQKRLVLLNPKFLKQQIKNSDRMGAAQPENEGLINPKPVDA